GATGRRQPLAGRPRNLLNHSSFEAVQGSNPDGLEVRLPRRVPSSLRLLVSLVVVSWASTALAVTEPWVSRWRADLAFAADSVPRVHPNFFHAVSREAYRSALDSLSRRVPELEQHELVVELARIVAKVRDGHT